MSVTDAIAHSTLVIRGKLGKSGEYAFDASASFRVAMSEDSVMFDKARAPESRCRRNLLMIEWMHHIQLVSLNNSGGGPQ